MTIISYGDLISEGTYKPHSTFKNVLNFEKNRMLLSIVDKQTGNGPYNVVVSDIPRNLKTVIYDKSCFYFDKNRMPVENAHIYDSAIKILEINPEQFLKNLKILRKYLCAKSPAKSMVFLLDEKREKKFKNGFEQKLLKEMKEGVIEISLGFYEKGVAKLSGLGFGLTPSGDDFIGGYLLGIKVAERFSPKNLSLVRERIFSNAEGKNLISNCFIKSCFEGRVNEKMKNLIYALSGGSKKEIETCAGKLIEPDSTSGSDVLTGLLYGFYSVITLISTD